MVAERPGPGLGGAEGLKGHLDSEFGQQPHVLHSQASPSTSDQKLARVLQHVLDEEAPCEDLVSGAQAAHINAWCFGARMCSRKDKCLGSCATASMCRYVSSLSIFKKCGAAP